MTNSMQAPAPTRRRAPLFVAGALGVAAILGITAAVGGTTAVAGVPTAVEGVAAAAALPNPNGSSGGSSGGSGSQGYGTNPYGANPYGLNPYGNQGYGSQQYGSPGYGNSGGATTTEPTDEQEIGLVYIDTVLAYESAAAAGTGLVLTGDGEILTNNHVIQGATAITVTVVGTGKTYQASVVGADVADDIAVLQLGDASGLTTANFGSSQNVQVGDAVTGVGNAGGDGGTPSAAPGQVSALNQTITTQAEGVSAGETLTGLIETTADIQSGDSGGPLFNADDEVIGIDTAASESSAGRSVTGYAIPIDTALGIAKQIVGGDESDGVRLGYPAFLGVQVQSATTGTGTGSGRGRSGSGSTGTATGGATIAGVVEGSPAAEAGLAAGDTVIGIDSTAVGTADALSTVLATHEPGDSITVTWVDSSGAQHSAAVTLAQGPAA